VRSRQRFLRRQVSVDAGKPPVEVASLFVPQSRKILQAVQTATKGSERGFLQILECGMQGHCYIFGNSKLLK